MQAKNLRQIVTKQSMNIGIKVGPQDGISILAQAGVAYCEVWFQLEKQQLFPDLFAQLRKHKLRFGLHYWAMIDGKYFPNLVYYRDQIAQKTVASLKQTIDIAAAAGAYYVNYHPGSLRLIELDLEKQEIRASRMPEVSAAQGYSILDRYSEQIHEYALTRGIEAYIETVPLYDPAIFRDSEKDSGRLQRVFANATPTRELIKLGKKGRYLCYDIGHATGQYPDQPRAKIFRQILQDAKDMAPYTRLVHINTTIEPLNGTDSHHGILPADFAQNVFPNKKQVKEILDVFVPSEKVLFVPEPQIEAKVANTLELKKWYTFALGGCS